MTPHHRQQTYYGYSFESFCTAGTPHAKSGWGGDVDTNIQWASVVKTKLGDTRLVIGGEVDCVRGAFELLLCAAFGISRPAELESMKANSQRRTTRWSS